MKRKMCGLLVLTCMMMALTGCRMYMDYVVNDDGTVTTIGSVAYTEAEMELIGGEAKADATLKTLEDGKQYYVVPEEKKTQSIAKTQEEDGIYLTEDIFLFPVEGLEALAEEEESGLDMYLQLSVALQSDVIDSNADVSVENNKAVFSSKGNPNATYWYAYTQKGKEVIENDKIAPKMTGAKNKRYYKKMPRTISFKDNMYVVEVKLNGKKVIPVTVTKTSKGKTVKETTWCTAAGKDVSKSGKNVFKVKDVNGNTSTFIVYVDKKAPTVKGIKNKRTYKKKAVVYVKDNMKLSKITINGKVQKMTKKQLVKKGKYKGYYQYTIKKKGTNKIVIKDAAGNKKTLSIKIKR